MWNRIKLLKGWVVIVIFTLLSFKFFPLYSAQSFYIEKSGKTRQTTVTSLIWEASGTTTQMQFTIDPGESPLEISGIRWLRRDTILTPIQPFQSRFENKGRNGKDIYWQINVIFPFVSTWDEDEIFVLDTNKGEITVPVGIHGHEKRRIRELEEEVTSITKDSDKKDKQRTIFKNLFLIFLIISFSVAVFTIWIYQLYRHSLNTQRELTENANKIVSDYDNPNKTKAIRDMAKSRFDIVNLLCGEYYEKRDSDILKTSIFNTVKQYIDSLKDKVSIMELEKSLNALNNGIMARMREQFTGLDNADMNLLIYVFSGFSPRTVCLLLDINLKQFYYRRNKIKETIAESGIPEAEVLIAKLMK